MALDSKIDGVVPQFSHLQLDAESPPGSHKLETLTADGPVVSGAEPPSPPASPMEHAATAEPASEPASRSRAGPATAFPYFALLPAELRLKIWSFSFLPRVIELHTRRAHYADAEQRGGVPKWQSQSRNPAALLVNTEARAAALECYTVALPLFAPPSGTPMFAGPGDLLQDSDRVLYLNLESDMVVLLGDLKFSRLTRLLEYFRKVDRPIRGRSAGAERGNGKGLRRLAMSVSLWAHEAGGATLKAFARTVLADIDEFVLFMYSDRLPPPGWMGGIRVLDEAAADSDDYRRFVTRRGRQFRVGDGWMVVGQRPMKVADISFEDVW